LRRDKEINVKEVTTAVVTAVVLAVRTWLVNLLAAGGE